MIKEVGSSENRSNNGCAEATTAVLKQIGVIHSPYSEKKDAPFQGRHEMKEAAIELFEKPYSPAIDSLCR